MNETRHSEGHDIELTHLDKVYFPESGITKRDVLNYYQRVAPYMLPHISDRALALHRYPEGIAGEDFYQQNIPHHFPEWIPRIETAKEGGTVTHVVCNDTATLVYIANQGFVIPHIWLSRTDQLEYPDRMVIDLDPPDTRENAEALQSTALLVRDVLQDLGLTTYLATTGSSGYHIYVPITRESTFDDVRNFARRVVNRVAEDRPDEVTVEQRKNKRGQRIFLDTLRNSYAHTAVAPYAVRARPGAPIATPLAWDEIESGTIAPQAYTIHNLFRRLGQRTDPWASMDRHAGSLAKAGAGWMTP